MLEIPAIIQSYRLCAQCTYLFACISLFISVTLSLSLFALYWFFFSPFPRFYMLKHHIQFVFFCMCVRACLMIIFPFELKTHKTHFWNNMRQNVHRAVMIKYARVSIDPQPMWIQKRSKQYIDIGKERERRGEEKRDRQRKHDNK